MRRLPPAWGTLEWTGHEQAREHGERSIDITLNLHSSAAVQKRQGRRMRGWRTGSSQQHI